MYADIHGVDDRDADGMARDGHLIRKIAVGAEPHGLLVWPQPGRYSLGHTGTMR